MSEERAKVLQMLADGKISVDEAERLLKALGAEDPPRRGGKWPRVKWPRFPNLEGHVAVEWEDLEDDVRDGFQRARRTVRASMPGVRRTVREAMPDVDNLVDEAFAAIPDLGEALHDVGRTISEAFSEREDAEDDREYAFTVEHSLSDEAPLSAGERLVLRNPRGSIQVRTWDREEVQVELRVVASAHTEETAKSHSRRVGLGLNRNEGALRVQATGTGSVDEEPCRVSCHFVLRVHPKVTVDLRNAHGQVDVAGLQADARVDARHGRTTLHGIGGDTVLKQRHGEADLRKLGGGLTLDAQHSNVGVKSVGAAATLRLQHSPARVRGVGGSLELSSGHGPVSVRRVGGEARLRLRHSPLEAEALGAGLSADGSHSPMAVARVGGDVQLTTSHGPVKLTEVGRDAVVRASHSPVAASAVGGKLVLRGARSPLKASAVGGGAMVRSDRGPVELREVAGGVALRSGGGRTLLENPGSEVTVQSQRGDVEIRWNRPVDSPCTVQCSRGSVYLGVPRDSSLEVLGRVERGRAATDLPLEVAADGRGGHTVSGRLGSGEAAMQVEVDRGHLSLMAAPEGAGEEEAEAAAAGESR